jgi:lipoyl(octanoyl) transferase
MAQVGTRESRVLELDSRNLLAAGPQEYNSVFAMQQEVHREVVLGSRASTIILLEHEPVFTAGKRTEFHERPLSALPNSTPVIDVDRGGKITWHGPGQLIGYPILKLRNPQELVGYVRALESGIIEILDDLGVSGARVPGRSGVWIDGRRKIAAIGIRVAQGVTMHGFAINANCSLDHFNEIVPCGISDSEVTTISKELGRDVSIDTIIPHLEKRIFPILESLI